MSLNLNEIAHTMNENNANHISLRDYFAGKAMSNYQWTEVTSAFDKLNAKRCYEVADSMMEARKK